MSKQSAVRIDPIRYSPALARPCVDGLPPHRTIESLGAKVVYSRGVEIYGENEPAEYLYKVVRGAVRTYRVLLDGRREVCAFHSSGDFLGLETDTKHAFSAEAIVDSHILVIRRSAAMALAERDREIARQLWSITDNELRRTQAHVVLLIKTAKERVAAFLLEMAKRMPESNQIDLPMSRQDIADYLGLTIETVSRTLTELEKRAAISLPNSRRVVLQDRDELGRYNV
jgi:CRP-like cAMP-binding protein